MIIPTVSSVMPLTICYAIMAEAGLSFLGLGDPDQVSLGYLISNSNQFLFSGWWLFVFPGLFLTLTTTEGLKGGKSAKDLEKELEKTDKIKVKHIMDPLWSTGRGRQKKGNHPYAAPIPPIKRFIALFSKENDLIVDPFAGGGTNLWVAKNMNRRIIGYEINNNYVLEAKKLLKIK